MNTAVKELRGAVAVWAVLFAFALGAGSLPSPNDSVPLVELKLGPDAIHSLREHPRRPVMAVVRINDVSYSGVRVHLKGSGSFQPIDRKPSFTIAFPRSNAFGGSKIYLNNSAEDATFVQEKLGSELFASIGIATPRISHARVQMNGRSKGLYVLKEGFDAVVYSKTSLAKPEFAPLLEAAKEPVMETRWEKLNALMDVDEFTSFAAMEVLICHWDGYSLAQNNFRVSRDSATQRFVFLPSGMDQIFGNPKFPIYPDMTGLLARALMDIPEGRARFASRLSELADKLDATKTTERAREILASLRSSVPPSQFTEMQENLEDLCPRILAREKYVRSQFRTIASAQGL
jgi:spore coat protein H